MVAVILFVPILVSSGGKAVAPLDTSIPENTGKTYYVSTSGDDANPGTSAQPFKTIQKAAEQAMANKRERIGTRIVVKPGIYRGNVSFEFKEWEKTNTTPIVLESEIPRQAVVSGSDVWVDWFDEGKGMYSRAWPYNWGLYSPYKMGDIGKRREMVFLNDRLMRQVLDRALLQENGIEDEQDYVDYSGSLYIDEDNDKIYLRTPPGVDPNHSKVEVAMRETVLSITNGTT
jgi:hypothetical protein